MTTEAEETPDGASVPDPHEEDDLAGHLPEWVRIVREMRKLAEQQPEGDTVTVSDRTPRRKKAKHR